MRNLAILALLLSVAGCVQPTHSRQYESWVDIEGKRHPRPVGMDEQVEQTGVLHTSVNGGASLSFGIDSSHSHNSLYNIGPQHRQNTDMAAEPNEG